MLRRRLMKEGRFKVTKKSLMAGLVLLSLRVPAAYGQSGPGPRAIFEVASIKVHPPDSTSNVSMQSEPGQVTYANVTLRSLVRQAYGMKVYPLSGGGDALSTARYDVIAKAPPGTLKPQMTLMLQALLAERFKLVLHRETKKLPMYSLVVQKGGPKFRQVPEDGSAPEIGSAGGHLISAHHASMTLLAETLQGYIGEAVVDATNLPGLYDFSLDFMPDENLSADGEHVFEAVQRQLGLRLQGRTGSVEVVVIDHVESPSEN
jgi:uncharacterized protein (TIGR03435 family)